jgi:hypothetical protein
VAVGDTTGAGAMRKAVGEQRGSGKTVGNGERRVGTMRESRDLKNTYIASISEKGTGSRALGDEKNSDFLINSWYLMHVEILRIYQMFLINSTLFLI